MDFEITSYKCWVIQYLEQVQLSESWAQGQGHWLVLEKLSSLLRPTFIDGF